MQRTASFKSANYYQILGVSKELAQIKATIKKSKEILPIIFSKFVSENDILKTFIRISLSLQPPVNQECLGILVSFIKADLIGNAKEIIENNPYIWDEFLDIDLPNMIEKLSLYGNTQFSNYLSDLLLGLFKIANDSRKLKIILLMLEIFKTMINLGLNAQFFLSNIIQMINSNNFSNEICQSFCNGIIVTLKKSAFKIAENIDADIYDILMTIFSNNGFHWFVLDPEPCLKCFTSEDNKQNSLKLVDLQAEIKFSDSCFFTRFKDPVKVSMLEIKLSELRGHKAITGCSIYFCNKESQDLTELKNNWSLWHKIKTVKVKPGLGNLIEIELPTEITMLNMVIEFQTINVIRISPEDAGGQLYSGRYLSGRSRYSFLSSQKSEIKADIVGISVGNEREVIPCPRCNKAVEDKYGICSCGENAFQCLQCRNINYENLDAFLCTECGESRYCKIEVLLKCSIDAIFESITSQKELIDAENKIDVYLETIQAYYEHLPKNRENLGGLVSKLRGKSNKSEIKDPETNKELSPIIYNLTTTLKEYQDAYYDMMICAKSVVLLRHSIMNYKRPDNLNMNLDIPNQITNCFGCNYNYLKQLLKTLKFLRNNHIKEMLIDEFNIVEILVQTTIRSYSQPIRRKGRKVIIELIYESEKGCRQLFGLIREHVTAMLAWRPFLVNSVREEVQLLLEFTSKFLQPSPLPENSKISELTLKEFWHIFFMMLDKSWEDSRVGELISGFLDSILDMIFKTLVLLPCNNLPEDPKLAEFFSNNPAFLKTQESTTNNNDAFINAVFGGSIYGLYDRWQNAEDLNPTETTQEFSLKNN